MGLPAHIEKRIAEVRAARSEVGLNVRFIREDGQCDEFSFGTIERRDLFIAKMKRTHTPYYVPGTP